MGNFGIYVEQFVFFVFIVDVLPGLSSSPSEMALSWATLVSMSNSLFSSFS